MPDLTSNFGLIKPDIGDTTVWGTQVRTDLDMIDEILGSVGPFPNDGMNLPSVSILNGGAQGNILSTSATGSANTLACFREIFTRYFNCVSVEISVGVVKAGASAYLGIYSYNGLAGGDFVASVKMPLDISSRQVFNFTVPILLPPKAYWIVMGGDDATATGSIVGAPSVLGLWSRWLAGIATNPIVAGVMPTSLGAITYGLNGSPWWAGLKADSILG